MKKILLGSVFTVGIALSGLFFTVDDSQADCTLTTDNPNAQCHHSESSGYYCGETVTKRNCKKTGGGNEVLAHA